MKERVLRLKQVIFDTQLYPRTQADWMTAYSYSEAMKAGSKFPPIVVAEFEGKYILVDGKHRLDALTINKETHVSAIILSGLTKPQIFAEAVKSNSAHGRKLSNQERAYCIQKLQEFKYDLGDIALLVHIPMEKLTTFVADRLSNSITGQPIMLKAPIMNMAGEIVSNDIISGQQMIASRGQYQILNELVFLIETHTLEIAKHKEQLIKLKKLLDQLEL